MASRREILLTLVTLQARVFNYPVEYHISSVDWSRRSWLPDDTFLITIPQLFLYRPHEVYSANASFKEGKYYLFQCVNKNHISVL